MSRYTFRVMRQAAHGMSAVRTRSRRPGERSADWLDRLLRSRGDPAHQSGSPVERGNVVIKSH